MSLHSEQWVLPPVPEPHRFQAYTELSLRKGLPNDPSLELLPTDPVDAAAGENPRDAPVLTR